MGLLCRVCRRIKWVLFSLASILGGSFLVFCHIEDYKKITEIAQEITHAAHHEETLAHDVRDISRKLIKISETHMQLGRKIRSLDQLLQRDRHKVKVFGLIEKNQPNPENYTEETEDELMDSLMDKMFKDLHVKVGVRDIEEAVRVGFWPRDLPRAVKVSLATANLKETLLHENNELELDGFDIVDDRPYGVSVEIDKPEDCTLAIKNISEVRVHYYI